SRKLCTGHENHLMFTISQHDSILHYGKASIAGNDSPALGIHIGKTGRVVCHCDFLEHAVLNSQTSALQIVEVSKRRMRSRQPSDAMSASLVHEQSQWITARWSMGGKKTAEQTECRFGGIGRNAAVAQGPWDWLILILIVVEAADQFECRRTGAGQQRLEKLDHRQKIDPVPMHCAHAGHEPRSFKSAGFQYIQGILLVTNDGLSSFINHQIIIAVEEPNL